MVFRNIKNWSWIFLPAVFCANYSLKGDPIAVVQKVLQASSKSITNAYENYKKNRKNEETCKRILHEIGSIHPSGRHQKLSEKSIPKFKEIFKSLSPEEQDYFDGYLDKEILKYSPRKLDHLINPIFVGLGIWYCFNLYRNCSPGIDKRLLMLKSIPIFGNRACFYFGQQIMANEAAAAANPVPTVPAGYVPASLEDVKYITTLFLFTSSLAYESFRIASLRFENAKKIKAAILELKNEQAA